MTPVVLGEESANPGLASSEPAVRAYRVTVSVLWANGPRARRLTLATLRLAGPEESGGLK